MAIYSSKWSAIIISQVLFIKLTISPHVLYRVRYETNIMFNHLYTYIQSELLMGVKNIVDSTFFILWFFSIPFERVANVWSMDHHNK